MNGAYEASNGKINAVEHVHNFDGFTYHCPVPECWVNRNQPGTAIKDKPGSAMNSGHRVLYHAAICPDCDSTDITQTEVETGDGVTEIALVCRKCGTTWPVACVVDWETRP